MNPQQEAELNKFTQVEHLDQWAAKHGLTDDEAVKLRRIALTKQATSWQCDLCPGEFKHRKHLLRHQRTKHGNESHQCNVCGINFSRLDNLTRHKASQNNNKHPAPTDDDNAEPPAKQMCPDDPLQGQCSW